MKEITPKEKAKELIQKFRIKVGSFVDEDGETVNNYLVGRSAAAKSALICVEEIVVTLDLMELSERGKVVGGWGQDYWEKVKEEIQKL